MSAVRGLEPGKRAALIVNEVQNGIAEDCTAGATAQTHQMQITMHLPLLATVIDSESIIASLRAQVAAAATTRNTVREDA